MKTHRGLNGQVSTLQIAVAVWLAAYLGQNATQFRPNSMLKLGDQIEGMILTSGAADAPPLRIFCSPAQEAQQVTKTDCHVPPMLAKVAIGHIYGIASELPAALDWSEFTWELLVDEQAIDLASFGTYNFAMPTIPPNPSPVRDVFQTFTAWGLVLKNLKPGAHTMYGLARCKTHTHTWIINLIIGARYANDFGSTP